MKNDNFLTLTITGLTVTAVEKMCKLGKQEAQVDVDRIRTVVADMIDFWELEPQLLTYFDMEVEVVALEIPNN